MVHILGHNVHDPYFRLRAQSSTPSDELCSCPDSPPIKLMTALGPNPVHCMRCNLEVLPEAVPLPIDLVDPVADWASVHDALDRLWLDSGSYETWALGELTNPTSPTNQTGRALRSRLDRVRRCFYWLKNTATIESCPSCHKPLTPFLVGIFPQFVCEDCSLVLVESDDQGAA